MKSLLDKINAKLNAQGGFLKAVSVLVGGAAFAQIISFACLPILSRLYSPEDYSQLGIYVGIVSIFAIISCLRLDIAIPLSRFENQAKALLIISILSNTIICLVLFILLLLVNPLIQNLEFVKKIGIWLWFIPFSIYLSGLYSALQYWATRKKKYRAIAETKITQSLMGNLTSVAAGFGSFGVTGLIIGQILNISGGINKLFKIAKKDLSGVKGAPLRKTLNKYKDFPKYSILEAFANTSAIQLPIIVIGIMLFGPEAGYLMMAMKVLGVPMTIFGKAISQAYLANARTYRENKKLYGYTLAIVLKIFKIITIPFMLLAVVSPYLFLIIFGKDWEQLGYYVRWMIPWFYMQMLVSPISMTLHIISKQKTALILQVFGLFFRVGILFIFLYKWKEFSIYWYILSGFLFYTLYFLVVIYCLKNEDIRIEN